MARGQLTPNQLKELVRGLVNDGLRELLGDLDLSLQLGEALRAQLKGSLTNTELIPGDEVPEKLGLRW
jgi:hypothetical protein